MKTEITNLETLLAAIQAGQFSDQEMTELPTFGGEAPNNGNDLGVWSWDAKRVLIGFGGDLRIVSRDWYAAEKRAGTELGNIFAQS